MSYPSEAWSMRVRLDAGLLMRPSPMQANVAHCVDRCIDPLQGLDHIAEELRG